MRKILFILTLYLAFNDTLESQVLVSDSLALVDLYNSIEGQNQDLENWLSPSIPVNEWEGILVNSFTKRVTNIDLRNIEGGIIPESFNDLSGLSNIFFSECTFQGQIDGNGFPEMEFLHLSSTPNLNVINVGSLTKLISLTLSGMQFLDYPDYTNSFNLDQLSISKTNLDTVYGFESNPNITSLILSENQLTKIPDLSMLDLFQLKLDQNPLDVLPDLTSLSSLSQLTLANLGLNELPDLSNFESLQVLDAKNNNLTSFPNINNNPILFRLFLEGNSISEVPKIENFPDLETLLLHENKIEQVGGFNNLPSLLQLNLTDNLLDTIPGLENLTGLQSLFLGENKIKYLQSLSNLLFLESLILGENELIDLPSFEDNSNLILLNAVDNQLTKIPELPPGLNSFILTLSRNKIPLIELEKVYDYNITTLTFFYTGQDVTPEIIIEKPSIYDSNVIMRIDLDGEFSDYTWYKDLFPIEGYTNVTSPILSIDSMDFDDKGLYYCNIQNTLLDELNYSSQVHELQIFGQDSLGGLYIYDQLIVEYENESTSELRDSLRLEFDATLVDQCQCGDFLELWEFQSLADHPIELDSLGEKIFITDPNEIKKKAKRRPKVNEAAFNYPMDLGSESLNRSISLKESAEKKIVFEEELIMDKPKLILIDTGIDSLHSLDNFYWTNDEVNDSENCLEGDINGYNFIDESGNTVERENGHGTHLAGIITEGYNSEFELINAKVFGDDGYGELFDAICAIYYGIENKADIFNLSWGYYGAPVNILENAIRRAGELNNALVIASAGNGIDGIGVNISDKQHFPGSFNLDNIITVAAWDYGTLDLASFSNYSDSLVHIAAHGVDVQPNGFGTKSGTSQAAAVVSAAAMCLKIDNPDFGYHELKDELLANGIESNNLFGETKSASYLASCNSGIWTHIEEEDLRHTLKIYPNPTYDRISVELPSNLKAVGQINIFDLQGRKIMSERIRAERNHTMNLQSFPAGCYIVYVEGIDFLMKQIIIKQ